MSTQSTQVTDLPNLGGQKLNLLAKDDAQSVHCFRAVDIATGKIAMPFRHPDFAAEYYKIRNDPIQVKFKIISIFARLRNIRLMKKCNVEIAKHPGKRLFEISEDMENLENHTSLYKQLFNDPTDVDPRLYLDESTDDDDIEQCTNAWCLDQKVGRGKAADNIVIITDIDNVDWFVLIVRKNGPGRAQAAWAGGFVNTNETFVQAAEREMSEEVDVTIDKSLKDIIVQESRTVLPVIVSNDWDPRAKFVDGMENGATVTHYKFEKRTKEQNVVR
jgi:hypothetical protein